MVSAAPAADSAAAPVATSPAAPVAAPVPRNRRREIEPVIGDSSYDDIPVNIGCDVRGTAPGLVQSNGCEVLASSDRSIGPPNASAPPGGVRVGSTD